MYRREQTNGPNNSKLKPQRREVFVDDSCPPRNITQGIRIAILAPRYARLFRARQLGPSGRGPKLCYCRHTICSFIDKGVLGLGNFLG